MKIYTKTGDKGKTHLIGAPKVFKDDIRIECNGLLDEANSSIGLLRAKLSVNHSWQKNLHQIQIDLMNLMSHLATPSFSKKENKLPKPKNGAQFCEDWIDELEKNLESPSEYFLLPGGNEIAAFCHICRTQIRKAERVLVSLRKQDALCVENYMLSYINRLSDVFFTLARKEMDSKNIKEERWRLFIHKK